VDDDVIAQLVLDEPDGARLWWMLQRVPASQPACELKETNKRSALLNNTANQRVNTFKFGFTDFLLH